MNDRAVTFDFHNTLACCPEWFDLEVNHLPSSFLRWWSPNAGRAISAEKLEEADSRYRQLRREIMDHGNELPAEDCLEAVFAAMGIEVPADDVSRGVEHLMRQRLELASPVAGAVETVQALGTAGIPIGVISSAVYHPFLEWTLASFGIFDKIQTIVTSASAGFYKSRPELYLHAAAELGANPSQMVHVGDSLRFDVGGAHRAGYATVWLRHDHSAAPDQAIVPDLTLGTLVGSAPEIARLLDSRMYGQLQRREYERA
jgi:HAD superfamily hydrolase (TIGR01549 family)